MGNARRTFYEMKEIRHNTLLNLISRGIVIEDLISNLYILQKDKLPSDLVHLLENDSFRHSDIYHLITKKIFKISLNGKTGLKAKTGLMEYRYDK